MRYIAVMCTLFLWTGAPLVDARPAPAGFRLHLVQGHPLVDGVFVNGHGPYRFLLDTGATLNHLDPGVAKAIGLSATFRTDVHSATGVTSMPGAGGLNVAVDSVATDQQTFLFGGMGAVRRIGSDVAGVLGQEFLARFDYQIDLEGVWLSFGRHEPEGTRVALRRINGRPAIDTNLGWLVLDSGSERLVLFNVAAPGTSRWIITGTGTERVGTIARELRIGDRAFWRGDAIGLPQGREADVAGLLPVSIFRTIYVCNSQSYVVLK